MCIRDRRQVLELVFCTLHADAVAQVVGAEGAKNELKDLALVINGMLDRIELSYNSQKQFVSDASHEPVSYTHLDVYKRQRRARRKGGS